MLIQRVPSHGSMVVFAVIVATLLLVSTPVRQASAANEPVKIGYLDLNRVVQAVAKQTPEYEELNKELEKRQGEIERRGSEIDKLKEELKANRVIWSEDKSKEREKLISDKEDDLRVYSEGAQRYRDVEENKILRRLLPDIAKIVKKIGERDKYSLIFEKRILLYGSSAFDLTDTVIKEMSATKAQ